MKITCSVFALFGVWSFAAPLPLRADPRESIHVGDTVAAMWSDGNYYIGKVKGAEGGAFHVVYEDGDKLTVKASKIFVMSADSEIHVGDHVLAVWKAARMFPGVVAAVGNDTCLVKWDDGDTPLEVAKGRMVRWPK